MMNSFRESRRMHVGCIQNSLVQIGARTRIVIAVGRDIGLDWGLRPQQSAMTDRMANRLIGLLCQANHLSRSVAGADPRSGDPTCHFRKNQQSTLRLAVRTASSLLLHAQTKPVIKNNGVVNAASFAGPGMPNYPIAQGSIFNVFGTGLGPAAIVQSSSFPVPTTLGGTPMSVTVGSVTVKPLILYTLDGQAAGRPSLIPPVGLASLTVTYNGQTSASALFSVVSNSFRHLHDQRREDGSWHRDRRQQARRWDR